MSLYPILLEMKDRLAVVVGGGPVGCRRAASLLRAGARVRLVSLHLPVNPVGDVIIEAYAPHHLAGAELVIAAANTEVNARVRDDAKTRGLLVNVADDPAASDFHIPSTIERGDLILAISTGAPAVSKNLRQLLETQFDDAWADWLSLQRRLRERILATVAEPGDRHALFTELADLRWAEHVRTHGRDAAWQAMIEVVNQRALP